MSNIYIQEPPTSGKILVSTTVGDIEIELWSKEAPLACRNFVQLCLEGYYNSTIFHRLVPKYVIQGGDPTGTGFSEDSIYDGQFRDEPHSRLRFMRRGLVATANAGQKNTNCSQFFFTLDATPDLQNKHTIFGKVVGNTMFNMIKLAETDVDANDRPLYINRIIKTEVLVNPFDDIVPRNTVKNSDTDEVKAESKSKATKNFGLLSFGFEAEEEEEQTIAAAAEFSLSSKSSHDISNDPTLSTQSLLPEPVSTTTSKPAMDNTETKASKELSIVQQRLKEPSVKSSIDSQGTAELSAGKSGVSVDELREQAFKLQKDLAKPKKDSIPAAAVSEEKPSDTEAVMEYKNMIAGFEGRKVVPKKGDSEREEKALARLKAFKAKLELVRSSEEPLTSAATDEADEKGLSWMKNDLSFEEEARIARDANVKNAADWYDLHDPRNPIAKRRLEASSEITKKQKSGNRDDKL